MFDFLLYLAKKGASAYLYDTISDPNEKKIDRNTFLTN